MTESPSPSESSRNDDNILDQLDINAIHVSYAGRLAHAIHELDGRFTRLMTGMDLLLDHSQNVVPGRR